jgi:hypothetical protein
MFSESMVPVSRLHDVIIQKTTTSVIIF